MRKINDTFTFPKELDLSTICTDVSDSETKHTMYDLQSIVVHKGGYGSGHYYAYVRPNVLKNKWFLFDDDRVRQVMFHDVKVDAFGGSVKHKTKINKMNHFWTNLFSSDTNYGYDGKYSS